MDEDLKILLCEDDENPSISKPKDIRLPSAQMERWDTRSS